MLMYMQQATFKVRDVKAAILDVSRLGAFVRVDDDTTVTICCETHLMRFVQDIFEEKEADPAEQTE